MALLDHLTMEAKNERNLKFPPMTLWWNRATCLPTEACLRPHRRDLFRMSMPKFSLRYTFKEPMPKYVLENQDQKALVLTPLYVLSRKLVLMIWMTGI